MHRDVSPQNVLLTYEGVVKVVDFGVAKATSRASNDTEAGQLKGKIAYMSPEQLRGERIDRRTDVFAMGILLYMMTTGTHPFRGDDQGQTIRRISDDEPVTPPSAIVPGFPAGLEAVVLQALAKDASKRYPTANDMLIGLTRALPPSMRPSTDEEVAEFLRALLPDRLEKRKSAIKSALEAADRREAGKSLPRVNNGEHETPDEAPTVLEGLVSSRETTPSTEEGQHSLPGATVREALSPSSRDRGQAPDRNRLRTALSVALVAAVGRDRRSAARAAPRSRGHRGGLSPGHSDQRRRARTLAVAQRTRGQSRRGATAHARAHARAHGVRGTGEVGGAAQALTAALQEAGPAQTANADLRLPDPRPGLLTPLRVAAGAAGIRTRREQL